MSAMRIALVYPSYWPYVRRGVERYMHDLAGYLGSRGHRVDILTSKPGQGRELCDGRVRTVYFPQLSHPVLARYRPLLRFYTFGLSCLPTLLRESYDATHIWMYPYGPALRLARRLRATPYLYQTIVNPPHLPGPFDRWVFESTFYAADRVAVLTRGAAAEVRRMFGLEPIVLPPPVDLEVFRPVAPKDLARPRVLFTGDLGDVRKGSSLLLRAWNRVHHRRPEAVLVLAGPSGIAGEFAADVSAAISSIVADPGARRQIEILRPGPLEALPRLYSEAAVTVLPSVDEPFGMVLIESLACGTPVVCNSLGGPGEIVDDPRIGATLAIRSAYDVYIAARAQELAEAILSTIDLAGAPETAQRCRAHASHWGLERVGRQAEAIYEELASGRRPAVAGTLRPLERAL